MKLLYFCPLSSGGLADYAHEQANALTDEGVNVSFLCPEDFALTRDTRYMRLPLLRGTRAPLRKLTKAERGWRMASLTLRNYRQLAERIRQEDIRHVLLGSYAEYFSPLWSGRMRKLARGKTTFGVIVHDPVRDVVRGPLWWHRLSVKCGYSFVRNAFVHENIPLGVEESQRNLHVTRIPHGPYHFPASPLTREEAREKYKLPLDKPVFLSFGHLRDGKNLDMVIQALRCFPDVHLLVAGKEQSAGQRPASSYREWARKCGVGDRCRWEVRFIPDTEVASLFTATDFILLTYSRDFRSASGVLNASIQFRTPCLATSGAGPLRSAVETYALGVWKEPDRPEEIEAGIGELIDRPVDAKWERYQRENSWQINARRVKAALFDLSPQPVALSQ